ncbi:DUF4238 domain-containing protein [Azorhizobium doebereinerae]|uniref:DUF4238 domain-containing protein n=1 Tax=Azorhizobium doebereinerae TaxID=281091 RepID=UPI000A0666F8|nr:DUF4238 domain-containing protein [Azorhizobium doebereinerae]
MAYDHLTAQTYLRHFQKNGAQLRVSRKSGLPNRGYFPKGICSELDGGIVSKFIENPRRIGEFRKIFEPYWHLALKALKARTVSRDVKLVVSGFMANLLAATPTSTRLTAESYRHCVIETARAHQVLCARHGRADPNITQALALIDSGGLSTEVDPDWARAQNAIRLSGFAWRLFNSHWTVIANATPIGFITSDNPFVFQDPGPFGGGKTTLPRFLPLSPRLCLYVEMDPFADFGAPDFARPPQGHVKFAAINKVLEVELINELVVACAEELVISSTQIARLDSLVAKYAKHRVRNEFMLPPPA